jgi:hypothetical protein
VIEPDEVIKRLRRDPGMPFATELLTGMLSARLTPRELMPVMEAIARDVAPTLGWRPGAGDARPIAPGSSR